MVPDNEQVANFLHHNYTRFHNREVFSLAPLPSRDPFQCSLAHQVNTLVNTQVRNVHALRVHHTDPSVPMAPIDNYAVQLMQTYAAVTDMTADNASRLQVLLPELMDAITRQAELQGAFTGVSDPSVYPEAHELRTELHLARHQQRHQADEVVALRRQNDRLRQQHTRLEKEFQKEIAKDTDSKMTLLQSEVEFLRDQPIEPSLTHAVTELIRVATFKIPFAQFDEFISHLQAALEPHGVDVLSLLNQLQREPIPK